MKTLNNALKINEVQKPVDLDVYRTTIKPALFYKIKSFKNGGERGSRTLDTLRYTHFPGVLLRPLGHLTVFYRRLTSAILRLIRFHEYPGEGALIYTSRLVNAILFARPSTKKILRVYLPRRTCLCNRCTYINKAEDMLLKCFTIDQT